MSDITEYCPLLNKKRKFSNIEKKSEYFTSDGISYNLFEESIKPPDPKNNEYDWIWWNGQWIRMYNDVFEEEHFIKKIIKECCCNLF